MKNVLYSGWLSSTLSAQFCTYPVVLLNLSALPEDREDPARQSPDDALFAIARLVALVTLVTVVLILTL